MFVDEAQLHAKAGDGGAGCVSFRREAHVAKGGPDGGSGGSGGSVFLLADPNISSLVAFKNHPFRRAGNGTHGQGSKKDGARGGDLVVSVPVGTVVKHLDGRVAADLSEPGFQWMAVQGGRGGKGNAKFLSNQRRAPRFAEQGEVGQELWYDLELKLVADVALVGLPNAGKSTLISVISAAKPKIADYPFTTLVPNLGVVAYDEVDFVVADVPGLIEGASAGRGLGHQFLRHVQRARVLVILVDLANSDMGPREQELLLLNELSSFDPELAERPTLVVGSRADMSSTPVSEDLPTISSITREGVSWLVGTLAEMVQQQRTNVVGQRTYLVYEPEPSGLDVQNMGNGSFRVSGREALRAVSLSDLTDYGALEVARNRLAKLGLERALVKAGARPGDEVLIGDFAFEFEPGAR